MPRAIAALSRMARRWRDTARIPEVFDEATSVVKVLQVWSQYRAGPPRL